MATAKHYVLPTIGSYKNLVIENVQIPEPKASEVLVKVHAVSLQYADLLIASGQYPVSPSGSLVPCSDMAGEVVAVGGDVKRWKVGDRVCANFTTDHLQGDPTPETQKTSMGGHNPAVLTEYRTFPALSLVNIPEHLSYVEASTLLCAALTAYNALYGARPSKAGDYVLILGTGGVSIFGLQFAIASGATVIATSSSDEKLKIAAKLGAKHVINYKKNPKWDEEVLRITKGTGVDHVIEVGGPGTIPLSINSTRMGGYIHLIGLVAQESKETNLVQLILKAVSIRGIQIGSVAQFADMNKLIEANPEATRPVVDKVFPFEKAVLAYEHLESQTHVGKVVIQVAN
ncbi:hypothetical protein AMATHDRAFT_71370 [Amanita thiersii Skay4041]|uniref:Enoyl reductase (ER) domain-containing protein n=1 Tax=Amanita thiersii Skay4041 TaxID=703135 RepID=A0A2A9NBJ2_9AGAR|nr:hypothetical protein AMATHDRAFT_71370 [Amanita thiersii Skay4041]